MINEEKNKQMPKQPQNIILEDRRNLTLTGVQDIDSFDEEVVIVYTELGELTIKGTDLHINKIDVQSGELTMEGDICLLQYTQDRPHGQGFFGRLFR